MKYSQIIESSTIQPQKSHFKRAVCCFLRLVGERISAKSLKYIHERVANRDYRGNNIF